MSRYRFLLVALLGLFMFVAPSASADGMVRTGYATRVKTIVVDIKLYTITSFIATKPDQKTPAAVVAADVNKQLKWNVLRDLPADKVQTALKEAFAMNGYTDQGKIGQFVGAFSKDLPEKSSVVINYDATSKNVTVTTPGGSATINGVDFMQGVWNIWFGKIDQKDMPGKLVSEL